MATERVSSHGRGGAGNIKKADPTTLPKPTPEDLITPTLKGEHYTTGRGGTGNMARNDPNFPEIARASQDVEAPAHREHEGPHHYGRGGAANVARPAASDEERRGRSEEGRTATEAEKAHARHASGSAEKGLVDKGKEFLGKLGKK